MNCTGGHLKMVPNIFNPRLEELDLSHNAIKELGASSGFNVYPHLRRLDISQNELQSLPDGGFVKQTKLEVRTTRPRRRR